MIFDLKNEDPSIIKVIGVGGGGSNAVTHMYKQGIVGVDFAICNTDIQAMDLSPVPVKIQLGPGVSAGLGAGSRPQKGKEACIESIEFVKEYLEKSTKMLFITAGMGGGTGTGAAPIIAKAAQEMGILTVGIVTLPFTFEGKKRMVQGHEGLEELKNNVDTLIVISNDKLRQIYGNLSISGAFAQADNILTTAAKGIAEIITVPGYVNVDFEDVNTVMRGSGVAIMGIGVSDGDNRAKKAVDAALSSQLLEENNIQGAQHILVNITSGSKEVTMDEIFEITEFVQEEAGFGTNLIWGNCYDDTLGDKLSVTVIATGFETKTFGTPLQTKGKLPQQQPTVSHVIPDKIRVPLDDTPKRPTQPTQPRNPFFNTGSFDEGDKNSGTIDLDSNRFVKPRSPQYNYHDVIREEREKEKERERARLREQELEREREREKELLLKNEEREKERLQEEDRRKKQQSQEMQQRRERVKANFSNAKLNNPQTIIELENEPAYLRRGVRLENVPHSSERNMSKWSIDDEDLRTSGNSFLHDNAD
jgi:cell division protein FtsZ